MLEIKQSRVTVEFLKYAVVGVIAFAVDFALMSLCREFLFPGTFGVYLAVACGFIAGLAVNYALSIRFVFLDCKGDSGRSAGGFLGFCLIGVIGLGLTQLIVWVGVDMLSIHYMLTKIFATGVVFLFNFIARKLLIFR